MSGMRGGSAEVDLRRRRAERRKDSAAAPPLDECGMAPFFSIRRHIVTHERTTGSNPRKGGLECPEKLVSAVGGFESRISRVGPLKGVEKNQLGRKVR